MFYLLEVIYTRSGTDYTRSGTDYTEIDGEVIAVSSSEERLPTEIDGWVIAVSSSEERLQAIIDKTDKVQRPTQEMRGPSFDACASEWNEKVSEILEKENIPSACWPEWESDITSIYFAISPVTEV